MRLSLDIQTDKLSWEIYPFQECMKQKVINYWDTKLQFCQVEMIKVIFSAYNVIKR